MKPLSPISNSFDSANIYGWESMAMAVEFLFVGGDSPLETLKKSGKGLRWRDRLNNEFFTEIDHDCEYALNGLLNSAPKGYERSGWYRLITAVPI